MMQNTLNINVDDTVQQIYLLCPNLPRNEQTDVELRAKLREQLVEKIPQVKLEYLDLKCIIMNVKKSLTEFQKRIDESVAQQQLRRTTRIRKTLQQDPAVVHFLNPGQRSERKVFPSTVARADIAPVCTNSKCCHQVSELGGLVQVESLPVSASTNLLTIFVPSILQEKLHSCKYKISIDLNRLDLTKKILDLNVGQHVNPSVETEEKERPAVEAIEVETDKEENDQGRTATCEIAANIGPSSNVQTVHTVETQTPITPENYPKIEIKASPDAADHGSSLDPVVSIVADTELPPPKKRGPKRKEPKPPSNDPPKKRGRKPGSKNKKKTEKSEIAKYVEMFACNAGSPSAVSQIVTSTTQNWDILPEQNGHIAYFMNGEWTLNAPNGGRQLVSTTNGTMSLNEATVGGQEPYIPFDDFVSFIDDPSIDAGNNVIARVLNGSVDTVQGSQNSQQPDALGISVEISPVTEGNENPNGIRQNPSTPRAMNENTHTAYSENNIIISHSTVDNKKISANGEILNLSKEYSISLNDVLDLTQKKANDAVPSQGNVADKTVIFSTSRSMPSLDDMEADLFCSVSQRSENLDKRVVFSIQPHASPTCTQKSVHSVEGDSIADSAIEIDRSGTLLSSTESPSHILTPLKDKTKAEIIKGMSLLEIEKDIDDSLLDFDNCLDDDLLSLAPSSCFNSPTEDRFADSNFLGIDQSIEKPSECADVVTNSAPAARSHLELVFPKDNEEDLDRPLKNFKIPRVKPSNDGPSKELPPAKVTTDKIATQPDPVNTLNPTVLSAYPGVDPKPVFPSVPSNITTDSSVAANSSSETISTREISKMFGSPCYQFLADKCFDTTCKFSHQLLELNVINTSLSFLRSEVLHSAYRFIWRHNKLFKFYFPIFCEEYSRRNMRRKLSTMISDCEIQQNCIQYLRNIYSALINSGLNRTNACRFVLSRVKDRSHVAIDILMEMIIESGAVMFSSAIEQFSQIISYKFRMRDINELASACLRSGSAELITVVIKCLINVDQSDFVAMRSPELIRLLEMIKDGAIDGL